eukprot:GEMP01032761.1.p1 GENE.GEMP01032761.1~~GEMP01032761.1.p1  ORF type:complete len:253 (+),score=18.79 GEMP01032761.1:100-858(+)
MWRLSTIFASLAVVAVRGLCAELVISNLKFTGGDVNLPGTDDPLDWFKAGVVDVKCELKVDSDSRWTSIKWDTVRPQWEYRIWRFRPRGASSHLTIKCVDDDTHDASYDDDIGTYQAAVSALPHHVRSWIHSGDGEVYIEFDTQCIQAPYIDAGNGLCATTNNQPVTHYQQIILETPLRGEARIRHGEDECKKECINDGMCRGLSVNKWGHCRLYNVAADLHGGGELWGPDFTRCWVKLHGERRRLSDVTLI